MTPGVSAAARSCRRPRPRAAAVLGVFFFLASALPALAEGPSVPGARADPVAFADLAGWPTDDHAAALATFRAACAGRALDKAPPPLALADLEPVCRAATGVKAGSEKTFFETHFGAFRILPDGGRSFLTGYFEPEYPGSLTPDPAYPTPLLARPPDLVSFALGETPPGLDPSLAAARRTPQGLEPYPDRAAIEDGALGPLAVPVVYLRDPVDALIVHVQGSARIRLPDGRTVRVAYAGKNGHPFTAVGRVIVERGHIPLDEMTLSRWTSWLKAHPDEARDIIRQNRSFIFFRLAEELAEAEGPIGGLGVPLTPRRSLAIDRRLWPYALPVFLEGAFVPGEPSPFGRLLVAMDTGSAITGPARADYFWGAGREAGRLAGLTRHDMGFVVLWPKAAQP